MCKPMADSSGCMAEANTILRSSYPPMKSVYFKKLLKKIL